MTPRLGPPPKASSPSISRSMRGNIGSDTRPERLLRAALCANGFRHYRLNYSAVPGRPDVAFPRARIAVFVHGCFWHRCPHCRPALPKSNREFWKRKFLLNRCRDARNRRALEVLDWDVFELWECEVRTNGTHLPARLTRVLRRKLMRRP